MQVGLLVVPVDLEATAVSHAVHRLTCTKPGQAGLR